MRAADGVTRRTGGATPSFRAAYEAALKAHLAHDDESSLHAAYELGRDAVESDVALLELASLHHDVLRAAVNAGQGRGDVGGVVDAASDFFLESLSAFEMVQRGFREAQAAALLERRHTAMLRRLSTLLADTSLALTAAESLQEVLQLVAEQARELTDARCALLAATVGEGATFEAVAGTRTGETGLEHDVLAALADRVRAGGGGVLRITGEMPPDVPPLRAGWLGASLVALDGRELGVLHLLEKENGAFTELDEAIVAHLAEMVSAAIERASLYAGRTDP